jgi:HEAT repeat protein
MSAMILHHRDAGSARRLLAHNLAFSVAACLVSLSILLVKPVRAQGPLRAPTTGPEDLDSSAQPGPFSAVAGRTNQPDILDLEPAVAQAELILAVRLVDVTETKIVHGGRDVRITEQFRFEPVRVLKGIFARESLLMTGEDLGIYRFAESTDRLARGQLMLVLLGRQGQNYFNCNSGQTLAQSIPRLEGRDDALLPAVDTLIGMIRQRDRAARVTLLLEGLKRAKGRAVAPLLRSLDRRALLAAHAPGATEVIMPHVKAGTPANREVAARTLRALLEAEPSKQGPDRVAIAQGLVASLEVAGPHVAARVAVIDALGSIGAAAGRDGSVLARLKAVGPTPTLAETAARLRALGRLGVTDQKGEIARMLETLPLDAPADVQEAAGRAIGRLDSKAAAMLISSRIVKKHSAGLGTAAEIELLGRLPAPVSVPELLNAWGRPLDTQESLAFAWACSMVADNRLVPAVSTLLDPRQWQIRAYAVEALTKIDTEEAASTLWPHLDEEIDLSRKLRLIAFLGRHGFKDGYAQTIEHLSQAALRDEAVAALGAIGEPKAIPELRRIWQTSNDLAWNAAAIRALARLGQADIAPRLLALARTPGDALAPSALIGLGDLGSADALPIVNEALSSRSDELVIAACRAAAKLLARPGLTSDAARDRLAALLADPDAAPPVRQAALESMVVLGDSRLAGALASVARDANLEGTPLLIEAEREIAKHGFGITAKSK